MAELSFASRLHRVLWICALVLASLILSLGFACALPFAAFAAIAALTLSRRDAFALIGIIFLANQILGFAIHHYPLAMETLAWGAALGLVAVLSTLAAQSAKGVLPRGGFMAAAAAFLAAFAVYEGSLFAIPAALGSGFVDYAPSIVARIFAINAAAFAALMLIRRLAASTQPRTETALPYATSQARLTNGTAAPNADMP
jgi:hypothetical protein